VDPGLIELFADGTENALPDSGRLDGLGLGSGSVVFMLIRLGWRWEACGSSIALSGEGLVATKGEDGDQLVTGGSPMTEGRHYREVELTWAGRHCEIFDGAVLLTGLYCVVRLDAKVVGSICDSTESQVYVLYTWMVLELTAAKYSPPLENLHSR
jgi:hypothetical protein